MVKPVRIQRKRTKGYNMQEHSWSINRLDCVYVGRPTSWGNPYPTADDYRQTIQDMTDGGDDIEKIIIAVLRGKNLACWCPLDRPCHADVLLEISNQ